MSREEHLVRRAVSETLSQRLIIPWPKKPQLLNKRATRPQKKALFAQKTIDFPNSGRIGSWTLL